MNDISETVRNCHHILEKHMKKGEWKRLALTPSERKKLEERGVIGGRITFPVKEPTTPPKEALQKLDRVQLLLEDALPLEAACKIVGCTLDEYEEWSARFSKIQKQ
jgi:hypothetical protein